MRRWCSGKAVISYTCRWYFIIKNILTICIQHASIKYFFCWWNINTSISCRVKRINSLWTKSVLKYNSRNWHSPCLILRYTNICKVWLWWNVRILACLWFTNYRIKCQLRVYIIFTLNSDIWHPVRNKINILSLRSYCRWVITMIG